MKQAYAGLALLTDLDGTLLRPDKSLAPEDMAAIADFRAKGGLFSFATGRGQQASQHYLELFQPDFPAVMYNGALLIDPQTGQSAGAEYLPADARALLEELAAAFPDVGAEVLNPDGVFVFQDSEVERRHLRVTNVPFVMRTLDEANPADCYKALFAGTPERIAEMHEYVKRANFTQINFTRSHECFLEILPANTNKGTALKKIRTMLPDGIKLCATGDFDNDTAMLLTADYCGCPADSQPAVLEAVRQRGGYISPKTCANGFFAAWVENVAAHFE
ncbi:MAG: HAD family hydrolase, partial [Oscillospiraceae bacterium]|nr:HAD family hydrolase [Oscillospiraceae bacterium]